MTDASIYVARRRAKYIPGRLSGHEWYVQATLGASIVAGKVAQLADQTGKGRHSAQALSIRMPVQSYYERRPVIWCDGVDDILVAPSFSVPPPWTYTALHAPSRLSSVQALAHRSTSADPNTAPYFLQGPVEAQASGDRHCMRGPDSELRSPFTALPRRLVLVETSLSASGAARIRTKTRGWGLEVVSGAMNPAALGGMALGGNAALSASYYQGYIFGASILSGDSESQRDQVWAHFESLAPWSTMPAQAWTLDAHPGNIHMTAGGAWATVGQRMTAWLNHGEAYGAAVPPADVYRPTMDGFPVATTKPALRFGAGPCLMIEANLLASGSTSAVVFAANPSATATAGRYVLSHPGSGMGIMLGVASAANAALTYWDGSMHHILAAAGALSAGPHVVTIRQSDPSGSDPGALTVWLDGTERVRRAPLVNWGGRRWEVLGARTAVGANPLDGWIGGFHHAESYLTDSQISTLNAELKAEWGIA